MSNSTRNSAQLKALHVVLAIKSQSSLGIVQSKTICIWKDLFNQLTLFEAHFWVYRLACGRANEGIMGVGLQGLNVSECAFHFSYFSVFSWVQPVETISTFFFFFPGTSGLCSQGETRNEGRERTGKTRTKGLRAGSRTWHRCRRTVGSCGWESGPNHWAPGAAPRLSTEGFIPTSLRTRTCERYSSNITSLYYPLKFSNCHFSVDERVSIEHLWNPARKQSCGQHIFIRLHFFLFPLANVPPPLPLIGAPSGSLFLPPFPLFLSLSLFLSCLLPLANWQIVFY